MNLLFCGVTSNLFETVLKIDAIKLTLDIIYMLHFHCSKIHQMFGRLQQ